MGMFDRLWDADGVEWQSKAFDRLLADYRIGDKVDAQDATYQLEVLGGANSSLRHALATIERGILVALPAERDPALPVRSYTGHDIDPASVDGDRAAVKSGARW